MRDESNMDGEVNYKDWQNFQRIGKERTRMDGPQMYGSFQREVASSAKLLFQGM